MRLRFACALALPLLIGNAAPALADPPPVEIDIPVVERGVTVTITPGTPPGMMTPTPTPTPTQPGPVPSRAATEASAQTPGDGPATVPPCTSAPTPPLGLPDAAPTFRADRPTTGVDVQPSSPVPGPVGAWTTPMSTPRPVLIGVHLPRAVPTYRGVPPTAGPPAGVSPDAASPLPAAPPAAAQSPVAASGLHTITPTHRGQVAR